MKGFENGVSDAITAVVKQVLEGSEEQEIEEEEDEGVDPPEDTIGSPPAPSTADALANAEDEIAADSADHTTRIGTESGRESQLTLGPDFEPVDLTRKQHETLWAIYEQPTATQGGLADEFGVTGATISPRVNSVDGFDWSKQRMFAEASFGPRETAGGALDEERRDRNGVAKSTASTDIPDAMPEPNDTSSNTDTAEEENADSSGKQCEELTARVQELSEQIQTLEQQLETARPPPTVLTDPELAHKVLHACFTSDQISEEEELQILERVIVDR